MRAANLLLCLVLIFFATLQYNDPDVYFWAPVYLLAAFWSGFAAWRADGFSVWPVARYAAWASVAAFIVGFLSLEPKIDMNWLHVEEARESLGYAICATTTLIALFSGRRKGAAAIAA